MSRLKYSDHIDSYSSSSPSSRNPEILRQYQLPPHREFEIIEPFSAILRACFERERAELWAIGNNLLFEGGAPWWAGHPPAASAGWCGGWCRWRTRARLALHPAAYRILVVIDGRVASFSMASLLATPRCGVRVLPPRIPRPAVSPETPHQPFCAGQQLGHRHDDTPRGWGWFGRAPQSPAVCASSQRFFGSHPTPGPFAPFTPPPDGIQLVTRLLIATFMAFVCAISAIVVRADAKLQPPYCGSHLCPLRAGSPRAGTSCFRLVTSFGLCCLLSFLSR